MYGRLHSYLIFSLVSLYAQTGGTHEISTQKDVHKLEISFGQSLLYLKTDPSVNDDTRSRSLPMSSALFLGEWLLNRDFAYLSAITIPLTTQQTLVNGQLYHRKSSPTVSFGGRWSAFGFSASEETRCELQVAAMLGRTFNTDLSGRFFPTVGSRIIFLKNDGFSLYAGTTWSFTLETLALIYGVGHRF